MRVSLEKTEVTDMRKITVTEDNFEKVLEKLRKMCDKYKMLEFYRALSEDLTEVKCKTNSMGLRSEFDKEWRDKNGEYKYKVKRNSLCIASMSVLQNILLEEIMKLIRNHIMQNICILK